MNITPIKPISNQKAYISFLDETRVRSVHSFHASFPMYKETPLVSLSNLARELGISGLYVKDESFRFGLNAFKVLGGSYAAGRYIAKKLQVDISGLNFDKITSDAIRKQLGEITFVTATDGNHGRGVAWTARQLKQNSVVYMPKGTKSERLQNIQKEGAEASILTLCYDDAVRYARRQSEENGWVLMQDTMLPDYREIPQWIMEGYSTMAWEIHRQMPVRPTHIFLQAGVGSMAGTVAAFFSNVYKGNDKPIIVVVEPEKAACIFRTAQMADGKLHAATGNLDTMMAGLACGEPCSLAWDILESYADFALVCDDDVSVTGMRLLANPKPGDTRIVSGESGAVTTGVVAKLFSTESACSSLREELHLDNDSVILCISTEGATDRENYQRITGQFP